MERGHEDPSLPREHGMTVDLCEDLDVRPCVVDPRRTDEDCPHRLAAVADVDVRFEALDLPAERVAVHANVGEAEMVEVEHDHPCARAEDRRDE